MEEFLYGYIEEEEEACPACSVMGCECWREIDYAAGTENDGEAAA